MTRLLASHRQSEVPSRSASVPVMRIERCCQLMVRAAGSALQIASTRVIPFAADGDLVFGEPGENAQFHNAALAGIPFGQMGEKFVDGNDLLRPVSGNQERLG